VIINTEKIDLSKKTAWIFDMDGTLTLPIHDFEYIKQVLGVPENKDIIGYMQSLTGEQYSDACQKLVHIELDLAAKAQPAPGLYQLLEALQKKEVFMGILTRNEQDIAIKTLEQIQIRQYFNGDAIIGRNDAVPKPDPDGINQLLKLWKKSPEEAVMVGDYIYDLETGNNAGTNTILINFKANYNWPEASDFMISSLADLIPLL